VELERVRDILFFPLPCHLIDWNWKTEAGWGRKPMILSCLTLKLPAKWETWNDKWK
jgi:hypothetical protein